MIADLSAGAAQPAEAITARLDALAAERPALAGAAGIYRAILPLISAAVPLAARPAVSPAADVEAAAILAQGRPLLPALLAKYPDLAARVFDRAAAEDLACRIATALAGQGVVGAAMLAAALRDRRLDLAPQITALLGGETPADGDGNSCAGAECNVDPGLTELVTDFALRPAWQAARRAWEPALAQAVAAWGRGACYLCGAAPALAELRGNEGARYLRCGRCGAAWPYPRLACSGCGSRDPADLGVLYPEGDHERLRVETCERCHTYIKEIAAFEAFPAELLPVEDLATLYLDRVATERGYRRAIGVPIKQ